MIAAPGERGDRAGSAVGQTTEGQARVGGSGVQAHKQNHTFTFNLLFLGGRGSFMTSLLET